METSWPPNRTYNDIFAERQRRIFELKENPSLIAGAKLYYSDKPIEFINDWCVTYDPRNAPKPDKPTLMPFILFPIQEKGVHFISSCIKDQENGLIEKSRDMGATWLFSAFSVHQWLFVPGTAIGWGSRKEMLLDKLGDPDSIFEKMRMTIDYLPRFFWPEGFDPKKHATYMRIINPENDSTITGEAGDNIGRGGRKTIYFKDESAHYDRPEKIEAALGDNTDVQIDLSSVHGTANVFARRREAGEEWKPGKKITTGTTRVFIFDWSDNPLKDQAWYDRRKLKAKKEGLTHIFAQEVDRDYSAAVEGVCIPNKWVKAAIDAHKILGLDDSGMKIGALDIADEGGDKNAYTYRKGIVIKSAKAWGQGDTGETTRKVISLAKQGGVNKIDYDCIGIGAGVKAEANRLKKEKKLNGLKFIPWRASASPLFKNKRVVPKDKQSPLNKDFYANLKAQAWWQSRLKFERTYDAVTNGTEHDPADLVSIDSNIEDVHVLVKELSQATYSTNGQGKIVIDKKPDGTRSPNLADSCVICLWPVPERKVLI